MREIETVLWIGCSVVGAYLYVGMCKRAYLSGWGFTGAMKNVIEPPPPMLSSGQTNPHTMMQVPKVFEPHYDIPSQQGFMANCAYVVMENRSYDQRRQTSRRSRR